MCFIKRFLYFAKKDYTEGFLTFIRAERRRSNVMTSARVGSFCRNNNINIGFFDGTIIHPRNLTQRNTSLFKHNNRFSLIWKTDSISFKKAIKDEIETTFKVVDNVLCDKHVKTFIKYEYNPEN